MQNVYADAKSFQQILEATQRFIEKSLLPQERPGEERSAVPARLNW
jgi:hypothetical protein